MERGMTFTKELLEEAVKNSNSWRGVARFLGIQYRGDVQNIAIKKISNHFN